ncbi:hypothetical protein LCGC14_0225550 [marine sediment metagenome]|uniref:Uncharacterized protein n=1 Tax=marine sediment metagenome TaxID=412755 RepID=A0A0F9WX43_9ZZZZ
MSVSKEGFVKEFKDEITNFRTLIDDFYATILRVSIIYHLIDRSKVKKYVSEQFNAISEAMNKIKSKLGIE